MFLRIYTGGSTVVNYGSVTCLGLRSSLQLYCQLYLCSSFEGRECWLNHRHWRFRISLEVIWDIPRDWQRALLLWLCKRCSYYSFNIYCIYYWSIVVNTGRSSSKTAFENNSRYQKLFRHSCYSWLAIIHQGVTTPTDRSIIHERERERLSAVKTCYRSLLISSNYLIN